MARHLNHPSGPTRPVTINLPPHHLELLDRLADGRGLTRSALIMNLLDRVTK